jgi:hypothetical protein
MGGTGRAFPEEIAMVSAAPLRDPLRAMRSGLPELMLSQRRALANAGAAVQRDRRAAAERETAERAGDLASVIGLLAADAAA